MTTPNPANLEKEQQENITREEPENPEFIHGILYSVQELINLGQETAAVEIMKNSGIPKEDFDYCQEQSDYLNESVYGNLKLAYK